MQSHDRFLSTPSARRATDYTPIVDVRAIISIHALREEGDLRNCGGKVAGRAFLSTPSARRATLRMSFSVCPLRIFLSTPSARRATSQLS